MSASSHRSAMSAAGSEFASFPAWVLLDQMGQIGRCQNETTAQGMTRSGSPIEVSFVVADPPGLSRCFVHCPDLIGSNIKPPAIITGADDAFLLIRVFFLKLGGKRHFSDVFVYRAGTPSLLLVPEPYPVGLLSSHVGVLSCGDVSENCLVVVPEQRFGADGRLGYNLQVFSTKTKSWSTKVAPMASDSKIHYGDFEPSKVFSVGGGSLAWVDLQFGILMCKDLDKNPEMHLIELPILMPTNMVPFGLRSDGFSPPLDRIRDVTFGNGWFRCIELESVTFVGNRSSKSGWRATTRKRKIGSDNWELCCTFDSKSDEENNPTMNMVSFPMLDMYNDDVVFAISKQKASDPDGWVLAVNTKRKKVEKMVRFYAERLYFKRSYLQCAFSKHLTKSIGTIAFTVSEGTTRREDKLPLMLCVLSILAIKQRLRQFDETLAHQRPCYNEVCSLRDPDLASTVCLHIQQLAQYAAANGRGKAAYDDVAIFNRASEEINNSCKDLPACYESMREKIDVAVGALDNLLRFVPSEVLDSGRSALSAVGHGQSVDEVNVAGKAPLQRISYTC